MIDVVREPAAVTVQGRSQLVTLVRPERSTTLTAQGPQGPPGPPGVDGAQGPPGPLLSRKTATFTTASVADAAADMGTVTLAPGYRLLRIATDRAARIRLYTSTAARTADTSRPAGTDPTGDHGVMLDMVTTSGDLDWGLSPAVDGYLDTVGTAVPFAVTNLSGSTGTVTVDLTWVQTEGE